MPFKHEIEGYLEELTALRRDLHAHPEIAFEERRTADLVAAKLAEWGIEVDRGLAVTGVVGTLKVGDGRRAIALRADAREDGPALCLAQPRQDACLRP